MIILLLHLSLKSPDEFTGNLGKFIVYKQTLFTIGLAHVNILQTIMENFDPSKRGNDTIQRHKSRNKFGHRSKRRKVRVLLLISSFC